MSLGTPENSAKDVIYYYYMIQHLSVPPLVQKVLLKPTNTCVSVVVIAALTRVRDSHDRSCYHHCDQGHDLASCVLDHHASWHCHQGDDDDDDEDEVSKYFSVLRPFNHFGYFMT